MNGAFDKLRVPVERGATWTTDAPFRETVETVEAMRTRGLLAVEMEAAALYAFATAREKPVLCFAHVTNQMAQIHGDFEKGEADGTVDALAVFLVYRLIQLHPSAWSARTIWARRYLAMIGFAFAVQGPLRIQMSVTEH